MSECMHTHKNWISLIRHFVPGKATLRTGRHKHSNTYQPAFGATEREEAGQILSVLLHNLQSLSSRFGTIQRSHCSLHPLQEFSCIIISYAHLHTNKRGLTNMRSLNCSCETLRSVRLEGQELVSKEASKICIQAF